MERAPDSGRLFRAAIVLILITTACSSDDISGLDGPGDSTGSSTITSGEGVSDAPSGDSQPAPAGDDRGTELVGRWEISDYVLPDGGGLTNVVGDHPVFLEFGADGILSHGTGCTEGAADYATSEAYVVPKSALDDTLEGQPITIGPSFQQTEIGCEGFLGEQDRDLPIDMGAATRFRIDGDRLLLLDEFLLIKATKAG